MSHERRTILFQDRWFTAQGKWFWACPSRPETTVKFYDMPLVTTWDEYPIDLELGNNTAEYWEFLKPIGLDGELWYPGPYDKQNTTGEQIDMDEVLNLGCCEDTKPQCRPQNMVDVLKDKEAILASRLTDVRLAIDALQKNPELSSTLDLIRRVGRY